MTVFLEELGRRLADRWAVTLILPGLLFVAVAAAGTHLGHRNFADAEELISRAGQVSTAVAAHGGVAGMLLAGAALLAAAAAGLTAYGVGRVVRGLWLGPWPGGGPLTRRRHDRWERASDVYEAALLEAREEKVPDQDKLDRLAARRNRIALAEPKRPTWIADRMSALDMRIHAVYGLDLASAWPRLWLLVPDVARTELRSAAAAFDSAAALAGWATLYLLAGALWWPSAVIGVVLWAAAWRRGRSTISILADLAESTVDLFGPHLAVALGVTADTPELTRRIGVEVSSRLRKGG